MNLKQVLDDARRAAPDAMLLMHRGDFYEFFGDDAKKAARLLGLSLTTRDRGADQLAMTGFPHHQLDSYLRKLLAEGCRVAILEPHESEQVKIAESGEQKAIGMGHLHLFV